MKMTLEGYLLNPQGKKNAVISNREMYRELYTKKFDMILLREAGRIDYSLYTVKDKYVIHLKIPSEEVPKFYYDVVIEFYTDDDSVRISKNLTNYFVRFYSNDPSFVFTFAHAFITNDLFIKQFESKMSKRAVREVADEKNPKEIIGYVKALYFAILFIKSKGLLNKTIFETYGRKSSFANISNNIEHADSKIEKRQEEGERIRREKAKEKEDEKRRNQRIAKQDAKHLSSLSNSIKKTKTIGKISSSKSIKRTKTIKKI